MKEPLVSIIVPIYNAEAYLPACLDSIHAQTYQNLEVFLVNDGSTDHSVRACAAMVEADPRFHLLDLPNRGVSAARNAALDRCTGKYVQFVDGDDRLPSDATEALVRAAEGTGCDLVIAHFYRVIGAHIAQRGHIRERLVMTRQEFARHMMKAPANYYYGVLWNKLYRRSLIQRRGIRCDTEVSWCEDFLFNLEYMREARLVTAIPVPVYYYIKREGSLVNSQATLRRTVETKRMTFAYYKNLYEGLDLYDENKARIYRYLISAATDGTALSLPEGLEELLSRRADPIDTARRHTRQEG